MNQTTKLDWKRAKKKKKKKNNIPDIKPNESY
jgi:hypothetical protein